MDDLAQKYIRRIRNTNKRIYAQRFWDYLNGYMPIEPSHGLSYMAAQAVRMELHRIYRETEATEA